MVDIHHHLLWGTDDGAKDFDTSLAMARASAADGVTHIVCTPHANGRYTFDPDANRTRAAELQARLDAEGVPLTVGLGCDFHLSYDNITEAKQNPSKFSINGFGYLLVELPDHGIPPTITETFYELQLAGLTPILTHPERNPTLQKDKAHARLADWMRGGILIQVTGDSVTGKMGKTAEKMAHDLLTRRWVHFLATDAHSDTRRPPRLSHAHALVARKYGQDYAASLVETNPRAVYQGTSFEPITEPLGLYEDFKDIPWWKRFFQ